MLSQHRSFGCKSRLRDIVNSEIGDRSLNNRYKPCTFESIKFSQQLLQTNVSCLHPADEIVKTDLAFGGNNSKHFPCNQILKDLIFFVSQTQTHGSLLILQSHKTTSHSKAFIIMFFLLSKSICIYNLYLFKWLVGLPFYKKNWSCSYSRL
jgi:hypothetical protein